LETLNSDYDVIVLTESWLKEGVFDNEFKSNDFSVFRRDRSSFTSDKKDGGGVLILVRNSSFKSVKLQLQWQNQTTEDIWITLSLGNKDIHLCGVYISPDCDTQKINDFSKKVQNIRLTNPNDLFVVAGDFNIPNYVTSQNVDYSSGTSRLSIIKKMENYCNFTQLNSFLNSNQNVLDLVFSNTFIKLQIVDLPMIKLDSYHPALEGLVSVPLIPVDASEKNNTYRNFKKLNYRLLNAAFLSTDWVSIFCDKQNVDEMLDSFYDYVNKVLDAHAPLSIKRFNKYPSWFSKDTINILKNKLIYHKK
jgi:hypothetical protein